MADRVDSNKLKYDITMPPITPNKANGKRNKFWPKNREPTYFSFSSPFLVISKTASGVFITAVWTEAKNSIIEKKIE